MSKKLFVGESLFILVSIIVIFFPTRSIAPEVQRDVAELEGTAIVELALPANKDEILMHMENDEIIQAALKGWLS